MPYIQIQNLKKRYVMSKNIYVDALKDVTFSVLFEGLQMEGITVN
ncbi:MAG TPA: hypothetical protein PLS56_02165 [Candidatus Dojkabacteria bacterium]|nr:hypothetical protein [Candidatus Dojkabacteria bacterium]